MRLKLDKLYEHMKNNNLFSGVIYEDMVWAFQVVNTRLFGGFIPEYSMIPFLDSFNHSSINPITFYMTNTRFEKNKQDVIYKQRKN